MKMIPFSFENTPVRVADRNGDPWFVAKDVCAALTKHWNGQSLDQIPDDWKGMTKLVIPGAGEQDVAIINEAAVYKLAFLSNKPEAERFTNWVASDVLPTIRKTGGYGPGADPEEVARIATEAAAHSAAQIIGALLPELLKAHLASGMSIRNGRSAGEIWRSHGLPPIKNGAQWLANRMKEMGAALADDARGELILALSPIDRKSSMPSNKLAFLADCVSDLSKRFDAMVEGDCASRKDTGISQIIRFAKDLGIKITNAELGTDQCKAWEANVLAAKNFWDQGNMAKCQTMINKANRAAI